MHCPHSTWRLKSRTSGYPNHTKIKTYHFPLAPVFSRDLGRHCHLNPSLQMRRCGSHGRGVDLDSTPDANRSSSKISTARNDSIRLQRLEVCHLTTEARASASAKGSIERPAEAATQNKYKQVLLEGFPILPHFFIHLARRQPPRHQQRGQASRRATRRRLQLRRQRQELRARRNVQERRRQRQEPWRQPSSRALSRRPMRSLC